MVFFLRKGRLNPFFYTLVLLARRSQSNRCLWRVVLLGITTVLRRAQRNVQHKAKWAPSNQRLRPPLFHSATIVHGYNREMILQTNGRFRETLVEGDHRSRTVYIISHTSLGRLEWKIFFLCVFFSTFSTHLQTPHGAKNAQPRAPLAV